MAETTYYVVVTDSCGSDTASVDVHFSIPFGHAGNDTIMCLGQSVPITAIGGGTYLWTPSASLDNATLQTPHASPSDTTIYHVQITTPAGCIVNDSLTVVVQFDLPTPSVNDTAICLGTSVQLHASGGMTYQWDAAQGITNLSVPDPTVSPLTPIHYVVHVGNTCGTSPDTAFVDVQQVDALAWPDTSICKSQPVTLSASGGTVFAWSPGGSLSATDSASVVATPTSTTTYGVIVCAATGDHAALVEKPVHDEAVDDEKQAGECLPQANLRMRVIVTAAFAVLTVLVVMVLVVAEEGGDLHV